MLKRTLRTTLWMALLTLVTTGALADPEGFPGGGLKPVLTHSSPLF